MEVAKENSYLHNVLDAAGLEARYDEHAKRILADKEIMAWILKYTVREVSGYSVEEIKDFIEGECEINTISIIPGRTNQSILGSQNEDKVPGEGETKFDLRTYIRIPGSKEHEHIKIIINLEAQKSFYPGYDLLKRALYYPSRLLSSQMNVEFDVHTYDKMKPVYSIWILFDCPKKAQDSIVYIHNTAESIYGNNWVRGDNVNYTNTLLIGLPKDGTKSENLLIRLLATVFSDKMKVAGKLEVLEKEYDISSSTLFEEVTKMCDLGHGIFEDGKIKGLEEGKIRTLVQLVKNGMLEKNAAASVAGVSEEEFSRYLTMPEYVG